MRNYKSHKGLYSPTKPSKYTGNANMCVYRSLWERRFMQFCDMSESVLKWSSEEVVVPYRSPIDNRIHRYFVDFCVTAKTETGEETMLIEIKPKAQTKKPTVSEKKVTTSKMREIKNWAINSAKWEAATEYCKDRGWSFKILTEDDLFSNLKKKKAV